MTHALNGFSMTIIALKMRSWKVKRLLVAASKGVRGLPARRMPHTTKVGIPLLPSRSCRCAADAES